MTKTKTIIVTGTSRGIGLEMVRVLSGMDHRVIALSRNDEPVRSLNLKNVHAISFDLADGSHYRSFHWSALEPVSIFPPS